MRVTWLSDLHLDFLDERKRRRFADQVATQAADAVVISGDIADGWSVIPMLTLLATRSERPVYFVLGNHDFYHRGIDAVRTAVRSEVRAAVRGTSLVYLPDAEVVQLGPGLALVGHDGWADGRNGAYTGSAFQPNDFVHIHDFQVFAGGYGREAQRLRLMQQLADEAAAHFARVLPCAAEANAQVIAVTHVPPFAGASHYRGQPSDPEMLPFYSNRCVGDVMREVMARHPACQLTVLAGHTHATTRFTAASNVQVRTAPATYGRPRVAKMLIADAQGVR
ncbi:MAG TPA: metallophosphoesterase [Chloroflexota bacterium]|nr:metallophosphoesterase [Chloroflexota bacterium]